jgi:hypothetical protein
MSLPYDVGRFKSHTKSCSYSTASGGIRTLDSYGVVIHLMNLNAQSPLSSIPPIPPSPLCSDLPCLGITEKDDIRIAQYMKRTHVNSAGGSSIYDIAEELFSDDFKNLSQGQKDIVYQKQMQSHLWSNDPIRQSIHTIGENPCDGNACLAKDSSLMPCSKCLALLSLPTFRNAILRKCCKNVNQRYIPHIFQSPDIRKIYSLGLYELLNGVHTTAYSLSTECTADPIIPDM